MVRVTEREGGTGGFPRSHDWTVALLWSGIAGKRMANAVREFLRHVVPGINYWISTRSPLGSRWREDLESVLSESLVGIACFTQGSKDSKWLHYEVGRVAATVSEDKRLIPLTLGFEPAELGDPVAAYTGRVADSNGMLELALWLAGQARAPEPDVVRANFPLAWASLEEELREVAQDEGGAAEAPATLEKLDERARQSLEILRRLEARPRDSGGPTPRSIMLGDLEILVWDALVGRGIEDGVVETSYSKREGGTVNVRFRSERSGVNTSDWLDGTGHPEGWTARALSKFAGYFSLAIAQQISDKTTLEE